MPLPINIDDLLHGRSVEWERLEFKKGWNPLDALHTICAFANDFHNLGGGYIIVGVQEKDGQAVLPPVGIKNDQFDRIQKEILNLGHNAIQPNYHPVMAPYIIGSRSILVVWVPGGQTRPYKARISLGKENKEYAYFIRKGSSTVRARGNDEIELLSLAATVPFDDRFNQQSRVEDLSIDLMRDFLKEVGSDLASAIETATATQSLLAIGRQMNIIGGPVEAPFPINAGLLFFNPEPYRFFPVTQIDVVWFPDGPGGDQFTEKIFRGPLHRMTREALDYIKRNYLNEMVIKHPDRAESTRITNFPYAAIEEAIVNAVYHRSYEEREPIEIRITPNELSVLSFPGLDRSIGLDQLRAGQAVTRRYRNRRIGEFLKELGLTEGRSTGIPKILRTMHANGSPPPIFETDPNRSFFLIRLTAHPQFSVALINLPFLKDDFSTASNSSQSKSGSESGSESVQDRILNALKQNSLSRSEIAAVIGHKSITRAVRRALNQLMDSGVVEYTIPEKPQSRLQKYRISSAK